MDFEFLENPVSKKWVIVAPRRAQRPNVAQGTEPVCPFCPGRELQEKELYRVSSNVIANSATQNEAISFDGIASSHGPRNDDSQWLVRVLPNKFPFATIHEIIIHSPDHHKNFGELPLDHVQLVFQTYRQRYNTHKERGQVYIFHNRGEEAGESLPHPHTQLAVLPYEVRIDTPRLDSVYPAEIASAAPRNDVLKTRHFSLFCPQTSQWPDELWVAPTVAGRAFGEITDEEIVDLSDIITRLVKLYTIRYRNEFPFNFYIYPGGDWYLRLIPRVKTLGGFEIGTGIFINTQKASETISFIKEHFNEIDEEKVKENLAEYHKRV